jgi:voltage-gated potassium channel
MAIQPEPALLKIWNVLEVKAKERWASKILSVFMVSLILLNVVAVIFGTKKEVNAACGGFLDDFELFSIAVFTIEYIFRVAFCVGDPHYSRPLSGRLRFMLSPMSLIDLASFLPFYLPFLGVDLRPLRVLRIALLLSVFKLNRYYSELSLITDVFRVKAKALSLAFALMCLAVIGSATAIYYCENSVQPKVFSDIPVCMEWAVATLTTLGSDMIPATGAGRFLVCVVAGLGIIMFALPTSILGAGFVSEMTKRRELRKRNRRPRLRNR